MTSFLKSVYNFVFHMFGNIFHHKSSSIYRLLNRDIYVKENNDAEFVEKWFPWFIILCLSSGIIFVINARISIYTLVRFSDEMLYFMGWMLIIFAIIVFIYLIYVSNYKNKIDHKEMLIYTKYGKTYSRTYGKTFWVVRKAGQFILVVPINNIKLYADKASIDKYQTRLNDGCYCKKRENKYKLKINRCKNIIVGYNLNKLIIKNINTLRDKDTHVKLCKMSEFVNDIKRN